MERIYVQTASFSRELREDFSGSLQKIAAAGYAGVELFDKIYGGYESPGELKRFLDGLGLSVIGAHVYNDGMTEADMAYLAELSCPYLVCPGLSVSSGEEAFQAAELLNRVGRQWKRYGLKYGYHNHTSDYNEYGGKKVIDILLENTDPDLVFFELDLAWSWRNGVDAADFIRRRAGRFELIHIKETSRRLTPEDSWEALAKKYGIRRGPDGRPEIPEEARGVLEERKKINCKMGEGIIRIPESKAAGDAQGTKAYIVEREYAYTGDIFTSLEEDCAYLKDHIR